MPELTPERLALAALVIALLVQTARLAWQRGAAARRLARHRAMGAAGERVAEGVLVRAGFTIERAQPASSVTYEVDGAARSFEVRADLLVRRGGARYVVEVKTGTQAPDLASRATRRQVLEYTHAFAVDGVLLVDATRGAIVHVRPKDIRGRVNRPSALALFALGMGTGIALATYAVRWTRPHPSHPAPASTALTR